MWSVSSGFKRQSWTHRGTLQLPAFVETWKSSPTQLEALRGHIGAFVASGSFRQRNTFVMCVQELLVSARAVGNQVGI